MTRTSLLAALFVIAGFIAVQLAAAAPLIADRDRLRLQVDKETVLGEQAQVMAARLRAAGRDPAGVRVYAGEIGVIGYTLMDCEMIDSAGIVSPEALAARAADWERLKAAKPDAGWKERWTGTPAWSRELIVRFQPDYIASNAAYLHLPTLALEPEFQARYRLIDSRDDHDHNRFVVYERKQE